MAVCMASGLSYFGMIKPLTVKIVSERPQSFNEQLFSKEIPFDQDLYETLVYDGIPVTLHFTADWCIYCKYQEPDWNSAEMNSVAKENKVVRMVIDLTQKNVEGEKLLRSFKRNSIPTYVFVKGDIQVVYSGWASKTSFVNWLKSCIKRY